MCDNPSPPPPSPPPTSRNSSPMCVVVVDGKYHMLPTGELMIINITRSDAQMTYRCRTHHRLTQETVVSSNVGRLQLTGECVIDFSPPRTRIHRMYRCYRAPIFLRVVVFDRIAFNLAFHVRNIEVEIIHCNLRAFNTR